MYFTDRDVLFIHIPKCAGNSVMDYFNCRENAQSRVHISAIKHHAANPEKFQKSFKFTLVRNTYEQLVSMWKYFTNLYDNLYGESFYDFIMSDKPGLFSLREQSKQLPYITINKDIAVNYIGSVNNIKEAFFDICKKVNIPFTNKIPHSNRTDKKDYRSFYNDKLIEKVCDVFMEDINYFGFDFDDPLKIQNIGFVKSKKLKFI